MTDMMVVMTILAEHQKERTGMTGTSPDTCKCGQPIYPFRSDEEISVRRDRAFAVHQAMMIEGIVNE